MLLISPPFGNYLSLAKVISITGSFTLESQDGLLFQTINTLRYSFDYEGWINKIGLRNKGIDYAIKNHDISWTSTINPNVSCIHRDLYMYTWYFGINHEK